MSQTKRGYTGHEMLDSVGLIHMNGRDYDPDVGRFLSADPNIQFPESTQGFNRYTYVNNNPMSYNDPSGFFIKGLVAKFVGGWITGVTGQAWLGKLVEGFLSSGGDARAMFIGQISGGVTNGIAGGINAVSGVGSSLSCILAQGVSSKLQGGNFADGVKGGAIGMVEGIAAGTVVDAGERMGKRVRAISASGTSSSTASINNTAIAKQAIGSNRSEEEAIDREISSSEKRIAIANDIWSSRNELGMSVRDDVEFEYIDSYAALNADGTVKQISVDEYNAITDAGGGTIYGYYIKELDKITLFRSAVESGVQQRVSGRETVMEIGGVSEISIVGYRMNATEMAIQALGHEVGHSNGLDDGKSTASGYHQEAEEYGWKIFDLYRSRNKK